MILTKQEKQERYQNRYQYQYQFQKERIFELFEAIERRGHVVPEPLDRGAQDAMAAGDPLHYWINQAAKLIDSIDMD
jgi:hypothetical protein